MKKMSLIIGLLSVLFTVIAMSADYPVTEIKIGKEFIHSGSGRLDSNPILTKQHALSQLMLICTGHGGVLKVNSQNFAEPQCGNRVANNSAFHMNSDYCVVKAEAICLVVNQN